VNYDARQNGERDGEEWRGSIRLQHASPSKVVEGRLEQPLRAGAERWSFTEERTAAN
jgi:hypothetical protein